MCVGIRSAVAQMTDCVALLADLMKRILWIEREMLLAVALKVHVQLMYQPIGTGDFLGQRLLCRNNEIRTEVAVFRPFIHIYFHHFSLAGLSIITQFTHVAHDQKYVLFSMIFKWD